MYMSASSTSESSVAQQLKCYAAAPPSQSTNVSCTPRVMLSASDSPMHDCRSQYAAPPRHVNLRRQGKRCQVTRALFPMLYDGHLLMKLYSLCPNPMLLYGLSEHTAVKILGTNRPNRIVSLVRAKTLDAVPEKQHRRLDWISSPTPLLTCAHAWPVDSCRHLRTGNPSEAKQFCGS